MGEAGIYCSSVWRVGNTLVKELWDFFVMITFVFVELLEEWYRALVCKFGLFH